MLRVFIIERKHLYIAAAVLLAIIIGIMLIVVLSEPEETFTETFKYAYNKITPEQAKILISKNDDLTIIDIRKENEYLDGHIPNAILMPHKILKKQYTSLDKQKKYLIYCDSGKTSEEVAKMLAENGFPRVYVLIGGIENWSYELAR